MYPPPYTTTGILIIRIILCHVSYNMSYLTTLFITSWKYGLHWVITLTTWQKRSRSLWSWSFYAYFWILKMRVWRPRTLYSRSEQYAVRTRWRPNWRVNDVTNASHGLIWRTASEEFSQVFSKYYHAIIFVSWVWAHTISSFSSHFLFDGWVGHVGRWGGGGAGRGVVHGPPNDFYSVFCYLLLFLPPSQRCFVTVWRRGHKYPRRFVPPLRTNTLRIL